MSRPGDRVQRELATPDPCFLFRLLPPIQNAPGPGERGTVNGGDPARRHTRVVPAELPIERRLPTGELLLS